MYFANNHNNYAHYVPVQLITLIKLSDTIADAKNFSNKMGLVCHNHWFFAFWHNYQENNKEVL